jgi:hypothetical protein
MVFPEKSLARGDDRGAHLVPGVAEDFCGRIDTIPAQIGQQDLLAYADPPRNCLADQSGTNDDDDIVHFHLLSFSQRPVSCSSFSGYRGPCT